MREDIRVQVSRIHSGLNDKQRESNCVDRVACGIGVDTYAMHHRFAQVCAGEATDHDDVDAITSSVKVFEQSPLVDRPNQEIVGKALDGRGVYGADVNGLVSVRRVSAR